MPRYEYRVVPAPKKAGKVKGVKGTEARFAHELSVLMNEFGADGWEYQRTDTLPCEERSGLTGRTTSFQNMLVFRRALDLPDGLPAGVPSAAAVSAVHMTGAQPDAQPGAMASEPVAAQPLPRSEPQVAPQNAGTAEAETAHPPQPVSEPEPVAPPAAQHVPPPQAPPVARDIPTARQADAPAAMPAFRSGAHAPATAAGPTFTSRIQEGRTPRLGAARPDEPKDRSPGNMPGLSGR